MTSNLSPSQVPGYWVLLSVRQPELKSGVVVAAQAAETIPYKLVELVPEAEPVLEQVVNSPL